MHTSLPIIVTVFVLVAGVARLRAGARARMTSLDLLSPAAVPHDSKATLHRRAV